MNHTKVIVFLVLFLLFSRNAYAYLDPGAGSYILQVVIAFFMGLLFAIKLFWIRIAAFFKKLFAAMGFKK